MASLLWKYLSLLFLVGSCAAQCDERLPFPDYMNVEGYFVYCDKPNEADECSIENLPHLQCENLWVSQHFNLPTMYQLNAETDPDYFCEQLIDRSWGGQYEYGGIVWVETEPEAQLSVVQYVHPNNTGDESDAWIDISASYIVDLACTIQPVPEYTEPEFTYDDMLSNVN